MTIVVFARAPIPGRTKTRLAASIGADAAAGLAAAFLADTWRMVGEVGGARRVLAAAGERAALTRIVGQDAEVWPQGTGDLGARLGRILRRALAERPPVIALGADSPGLPVDRLHAAVRALARDPAVIGPADDGGFYLLGLRRCARDLFDGVPWGTDRAGAAMVERLVARGCRPAQLPGWFDVDRPDDLVRLRRGLEAGVLMAPFTAAALAGWAPG
jgi:rSAM/selenodomain-associated transferase 1